VNDVRHKDARFIEPAASAESRLPFLAGPDAAMRHGPGRLRRPRGGELLT